MAAIAPAGVELNRCYDVRPHQDEVGTKVERLDLIAENGSVAAADVPLGHLERCDATASDEEAMMKAYAESAEKFKNASRDLS